ncbi:hypothetical protein [Streptacidiphilus sp. PAMC 29251]
MKQFRVKYQAAEPVPPHRRTCVLRELPAVILVLAVDDDEADTRLAELRDSPGYRPPTADPAG